MKYFFLPEDLTIIRKKIEEVKNRISEALDDIDDSCKGRSDTFHDNFGYEQGQRIAEMWSTRLRELIAIVNQAEIVFPESFKGDEVTIGKHVTILDENTREIESFRIGSYWVLDEEGNKISYDTPLARIIMGAKIEETKEGEIGDKKKRFKIIKIEGSK